MSFSGTEGICQIPAAEYVIDNILSDVLCMANHRKHSVTTKPLHLHFFDPGNESPTVTKVVGVAAGLLAVIRFSKY